MKVYNFDPKAVNSIEKITLGTKFSHPFLISKQTFKLYVYFISRAIVGYSVEWNTKLQHMAKLNMLNVLPPRRCFRIQNLNISKRFKGTRLPKTS